jgi:hypothetical protein
MDFTAQHRVRSSTEVGRKRWWLSRVDAAMYGRRSNWPVRHDKVGLGNTAFTSFLLDHLPRITFTVFSIIFHLLSFSPSLPLPSLSLVISPSLPLFIHFFFFIMSRPVALTARTGFDAICRTPGAELRHTPSAYATRRIFLTFPALGVWRHSAHGVRQPPLRTGFPIVEGCAHSCFAVLRSPCFMRTTLQ